MPWLIVSGIGSATRCQRMYCWHQAQTIRREEKATHASACCVGSLALGASCSIVVLLSPWKYWGCCAHTPGAKCSGEGASPGVVSQPRAACDCSPSRRTVSIGASQDLWICFIRPPHRNLGDNTILQKG